MSKKSIFIASAIAAVALLNGCTSHEPVPMAHPAYQTGPNTKLNPIHHHCVHCNHKQ
ncbi:MAG: hypothetical protein AB8V57_02875 [Coxiella endosymbiont of Dermacentor nuttalli]